MFLIFSLEHIIPNSKMKKNIFFIISCLALFSCNNSTNTEDNNKGRQEETISPYIEEAFEYYLRWEYDTADTFSIYMVEFAKQFPTCTDSDTIITIGRLNSKMDMVGVKGVANICNRKTVILDKENLGFFFYNPDSLKKIDVSSLVLPSEVSVCCTFVIEQCCLLINGVQPSDYNPIMIK